MMVVLAVVERKTTGYIWRVWYTIRHCDNAVGNAAFVIRYSLIIIHLERAFVKQSLVWENFLVDKKCQEIQDSRVCFLYLLRWEFWCVRPACRVLVETSFSPSLVICFILLYITKFRHISKIIQRNKKSEKEYGIALI